MKKINFFKVSLTLAAVLMIASCNKNQEKNSIQADHPTTVTADMMSENGANPDETAIAVNSASNTNLSYATRADKNSVHCLYTESNTSGTNKILVYKIKNNGDLEWMSSTASGGTGSGAGLGSQGALALDKDHSWLYAVNAGSNSVSSFKVNHDGSLTLADTKKSGGIGPNSVSVYGNLLYVLNHGSDNVHGYKIGDDGMLTNIEGSTKSLSGTSVDAPQISFTPEGNWIMVTEKATN
ncbi:MAG: beta-propeller fold lactonase family protein, partial [Ginsengibacter sp.]